MSEVADENGVAFVDLFNATKEMYENSDVPLTINGVHLNEEGNRRLAIYFTELIAGKRVKMEEAKLDSLRSAVLDKNLHWFHRYRSISGNDVWGTRSKIGRA